MTDLVAIFAEAPGRYLAAADGLVPRQVGLGSSGAVAIVLDEMYSSVVTLLVQVEEDH